MPAITVKNIPPELYGLLKNAARLHRRSLNNEIIACLERELLPTAISAQERILRAQRLRTQIKPVDAGDIDRAIETGRP